MSGGGDDLEGSHRQTHVGLFRACLDKVQGHEPNAIVTSPNFSLLTLNATPH